MQTFAAEPPLHRARTPHRRIPTWRGAGLAGLVTTAWLAGGAGATLACTCAPIDRSQQVPAVSVIFLGEVVGLPEPAAEADPLGARRVEYRFRVIETLKGAAPDPVLVSTPASPAACGVLFAAGQRYLVFAHEREGRLQTTLCDFDVSGKEAEEVAREVRRILGDAGSPSPTTR